MRSVINREFPLRPQGNDNMFETLRPPSQDYFLDSDAGYSFTLPAAANVPQGNSLLLVDVPVGQTFPLVKLLLYPYRCRRRPLLSARGTLHPLWTVWVGSIDQFHLRRARG
jgi:hypothetical protein